MLGNDGAQDEKNEAIIHSDSKSSYGDSNDDDEEFFQQEKMYETYLRKDTDFATTLIINCRASLEECDSKILSLQSQLETAKLEAEKWQKTFQNESIVPQGTAPDPESVLHVLRKLESSEGQLKDQFLLAKRREAAILVQLSKKDKEISDLKEALHDLKLLSKPLSRQACKLVLDPAIHTEFTRMKNDLENAQKKAKDLQDDIMAIKFTPSSQKGKMLMETCRALQEENEEIGRQISEDRVHELSMQLAAEKALSVELRQGYQEMSECARTLEEETEIHHKVVKMLKKEIQHNNLHY